MNSLRRDILWRLEQEWLTLNSFIVGSLIGLVGAILGATAHNVNQLIGAEVLIGVAAGFQISFFWVVSEIVPMKWRYLANSGAYAFTIPTNPLAAKIALTISTQTSAGWRGCFYLLIGVNAASTFCWYFFYHPPTFKMLHRRHAAVDLLKKFDWVGLALFSGSILIFMMGLNWGGGLYAWSSGHVVGALSESHILSSACFMCASSVWLTSGQSLVPWVSSSSSSGRSMLPASLPMSSRICHYIFS